jgi:GTP cyclohydrolase II
MPATRPFPTVQRQTRPACAAKPNPVAQAVEALRRGLPVWIQGAAGRGTLALAVETASQPAIARAVQRYKSPVLVLTHARARTLKIRLYTQDVVAIRPELPLRASLLRAIADPTADLAEPLKGPFDPVRTPLDSTFGAAVRLAKLAGLLPAVLMFSPGSRPPRTVAVAAEAVSRFEREAVQSLAVVTRARVPLEGAEHTELIAFRAADGGPEHYAVVIGSPPTDRPVLVRLHSECFTGDLLGSLKCDCGSQLRGAVKAIAAAGGGVLLYLAQEGRGIGLVNKLRAYRLQDQGFDTIEANERLGFEPDERLYAVAARMLALLGHKSVRLLTNNPGKVAALTAEGIAVVERVPHTFPSNVHNRGYLRTKAEKAGHLF